MAVVFHNVFLLARRRTSPDVCLAVVPLTLYAHGESKRTEARRQRKFDKLGKGWGHRNPPMVKLKVLSSTRKAELRRLLLRG